MMYTFKPVGTNAVELEKTALFLRNCFPKSQCFSQQYLDWQYRQNPEGQVIGFNAMLGEEIVAHYVVQPFRAHIFGVLVQGALSLNTATHPNHQGKGLYVKLAEATYARSAELGIQFIVGVGNANSTHGLANKLGFTNYGPLTVSIGIGTVHTSSVGVPYSSLWPTERINWRIKNPSARYERTRNGVLLSRTHINVISAQLKEGMTGEAYEDLPLASRFAGTIWIGNSLGYKKQLVSINLPHLLKPSPLNLNFKRLSDSIPNLKQTEIHFEALDFDAY